MSNTVNGYDRASVLDMAYICGGNVDCAMSLCGENDISLSDDVEIDQILSCNRVNDANVHNLKRIREENIRPATALTAEDMVACPYGGINYMGVDIDFVVS